MLKDNHGRNIEYLRLAITDRCNLRCHYCMPECGIDFLPRRDVLSYEEMVRLTRIMVDLGITKVRITGGEPFVRKDFVPFLEEIAAIQGIENLSLTTNGTITAQHVPLLKSLGIHSVNLSLDTLNRELFHKITRRDELPNVLETLTALVEHDIPTKINAVIIDGENTSEILPLTEYTRLHPVGVRFIEEMPFNGNQHTFEKPPAIKWNHVRILEEIRSEYKDLQPLDFKFGATSQDYQIPGHLGTVGIIAAYSRTFCGSCNRIRVTPEGKLKTCLYDDGVGSLRDVLRAFPNDDDQVKSFIQNAIGRRAKDGFEAEKNRSTHNIGESMATIGG